MRVLLIAETNWLENIVLAQDSASVYLARLARTGEIEIAVSEYSFHEADGSLNRKHNKRACKVDDALSLLGPVSQTGITDRASQGIMRKRQNHPERS